MRAPPVKNRHRPTCPGRPQAAPRLGGGSDSGACFILARHLWRFCVLHKHKQAKPRRKIRAPADLSKSAGLEGNDSRQVVADLGRDEEGSDQLVPDAGDIRKH